MQSVNHPSTTESTQLSSSSRVELVRIYRYHDRFLRIEYESLQYTFRFVTTTYNPNPATGRVQGSRTYVSSLSVLGVQVAIGVTAILSGTTTGATTTFRFDERK
jgi:hypothetical protein